MGGLRVYIIAAQVVAVVALRSHHLAALELLAQAASSLVQVEYPRHCRNRVHLVALESRTGSSKNRAAEASVAAWVQPILQVQPVVPESLEQQVLQVVLAQQVQ